MSFTKINDGQVRRGSRTIALSNGYTYTTDNFNRRAGVKRFVRTDADDIPNGKFVSKDETLGDMTMNYAADSTPDPEFGMTFTEDGAIYALEEVGTAETKAGEKKINVTFALMINQTDYTIT